MTLNGPWNFNISAQAQSSRNHRARTNGEMTFNEDTIQRMKFSKQMRRTTLQQQQQN